MTEREQDALPGGPLGRREDHRDGASVWKAEDTEEHQDLHLDRTAVRWNPYDNSWYTVRRDTAGHAVFRTGPWQTLDQCASQLWNEAEAAREGWDEETANNQVARVIREGIAAHIASAARRWTGKLAEIRVLENRRGGRPADQTEFHGNLEPQGEPQRENKRDAHKPFEELLNATERWRTWHQQQ